MRNTTRWDFTVPDSDTDPDDVPTHLGDFGDQVDALVAAFKHGPYSALPAAGHIDTFYYVDSGGTNVGALYRDNGTGWDRVNVAPGVIGSITTAAFGDSPATGSSGTYADAAHKHGMPANPITAHLAASNPHPQYALLAGLTAYNEALLDLGNSGTSTINLDFTANRAFKLKLTGNPTLAMTNVPATTGIRIPFSLELLQDATGGRTVTWPGSWDWGTAGAPTLSAANKRDFITGYSDDNGTTWRVAYGAGGGW